jgi:hypothetical protein
VGKHGGNGRLRPTIKAFPARGASALSALGE